MPDLAIDYSSARPNPAVTKAAGYIAVLRYFSGGTPGKDLTAGEASGLLAAGLGVGVIWETTAQRSTAGASAGTADGEAWIVQAHQVGIPAGVVAFANVGDWAVTSAQFPAVEAYYKAFAAEVTTAGYFPGGYGPGWVIDHLVAAGCRGFWWQNAMNDNGQPGSTVSTNAHLYQRVSPTRTIAGTSPGSFDEDVILAPIPWWTSAPSPPAPKGPPVVNVNKPPVALCAVPGGTAADYWITTSDGGVFTFGAAPFYGSMGGKPLNSPIIGMEATPTGKGYWLLGGDGGVFTYGDAVYSGRVQVT